MKIIALLIALPLCAVASSPEDEARARLQAAADFGRGTSALLTHNEVRPFWPKEGGAFCYRVNTGPKRHRFVRVNLRNGEKTAAFDHTALAGALTAKGHRADPQSLPIDALEVAADTGEVRFRAFGKGWRFVPVTKILEEAEVATSAVELLSPAEARRRRSESGGEDTVLEVENATSGEIELLWLPRSGEPRSYGRLAAGSSRMLNTYAGHVWLFADEAGEAFAGTVAGSEPTLARVAGNLEPPPPSRGRRGADRSPDGKWRALIDNHNVVLRGIDNDETVALTRDGSSADSYTGPFQWSPDSRRLVAWRVKPVEERQIHIVQSSPDDQVQPKLVTHRYAKPGDPIEQPLPRLFDIGNRSELPLDTALFENPWSIREGAWSADSAEFRFVYNQRGHQVIRILAIRGDSGSVRVIQEERSETFIDYSQKYFYSEIDNGRAILWMSEHSGYNHLYRIDPAGENTITPITRGDWNVREVVEVDEKNRRLLLKVVGLPGSSPYHHHFMWVGFDGGEPIRLTEADGNHEIRFSPDKRYYLATWSRPDQPPVTELRRAADGRLIAELERADDSALTATGWSRPERFHAKGRDGETEIHGIIVRPRAFDPSRRHPVVEDIYAGPHDHFVPRGYRTWSGLNELAELGFVVVKIDGMGTNWRSKAFHDVAWKNLMDSGFPDRIPWIRAAAATRPWMDLSRVGLVGGSAGGQSTLSGLLHHGDFYQVGVADCGCHDNRMDKIWWNEAWMGWPVDESYTRNSNVTHAHLLRGKLLLVVGELDSNVDPASTYQVVGALQKAGKHFDFVPIINAGHGAAETPYGKFRRAEFLIRHLRP